MSKSRPVVSPSPRLFLETLLSRTVTQQELDWQRVVRHLLDLIHRDDGGNENQLLTDLFRSLTSPFVQHHHGHSQSNQQTVSIESVFSLLRETLSAHSETRNTDLYRPPIASLHGLDIAIFLIDQLIRHLKAEAVNI